MHNRKLNVLDCMLEKMEQYSNNLEQVIAQRTTELMEEKEKTDQLLYRMLPRCVHAMRGAEGGGARVGAIMAMQCMQALNTNIRRQKISHTRI